MMRSLGWLALALTLVACCPSKHLVNSNSRELLEDFVDALAAQRYEEAAAMLGPGSRHDAEALQAYWKKMESTTARAALENFVAAIEQGDCEALARQAPPGVIRTHGLEALERGCRQQLVGLKEQAVGLRRAGEKLRAAGPGRQEAEWRPGSRLILAKEGQRWYVIDY